MVDESIALLNSLYDNGDLSVDQHAGIMRGFIELQEWQEKVCAIIQPAENSTEWGMDVADIIALRENQRRETRAELAVSIQHARAYLEYVNHYTDIERMSADQRQLYDVAWDSVRRKHHHEMA